MSGPEPGPDEGGLLPLSIDVVSIMSQVVYGRVGNAVALPILSGLGLNVAAVPTVVLSNTPHYPSMHGGVVPLDWFEGFLEDLLARDALRHLQAVVLGYLGGPAQAAVITPWLEKIRAMHPGLAVIMDPVLGDDDHGIYVDPALVAVYRDQLAGHATGLTPNGFELGLLTGLSTAEVEQVAEAARRLLGGPVQWVVVTSAAPATWNEGDMKIMVVTPSEVTVLTHPRLPVSPKGTGDLFAASLTGRIIGGASVTAAARQAHDDVLNALRATQAAHCAELVLASPGTSRRPPD